MVLSEMIRTDSIDQAELQQILRKYGWPGESKVGEKGSRAIFLTLQHSGNLQLMDSLLPVLKGLANIGEARKQHAALLEDRVLMMKGKKQLFGSQITNSLRGDGVFVVWPVEDPANVNKRRAEVGLMETIEEYARRMNAIYDPNEKLR